MTSPTSDLGDLAKGQIEERIASLEDELEDIAMERSMTLRGTGVHIGGAEAERLRNEFERDERRVTAKLEVLRSRL
ncbi:MAG: hypothetical protein KKA32_09185 [Actinobacteria bacterium]|nr:hypothetical protein [Actinomycetota bacterium]